MGKIGDLFVRLGLKSDDYKKGMADAKKETSSFAAGLGKMKAGAVAVWAAIGAGVTAFAKSFVNHSQTMGDMWNLTTNKMSAVWNQFLTSLTSWDWEGFGQRIKDAMDSATESTLAHDAEFEVQNSIKLRKAAMAEELAQLQILMRDTRKSYDERAKAAEDYLTKVEPLYKAEMDLRKRIYLTDTGEYLKNAGLQETTANRDLLRTFVTDIAPNEYLMGILNEYQKKVQGKKDYKLSQEDYKALDAFYAQYGNNAGAALSVLAQYYQSTNDDAATKMVEAIANYDRSIAAFAEETRKVRTLQNSALAQLENEVTNGNTNLGNIEIGVNIEDSLNEEFAKAVAFLDANSLIIDVDAEFEDIDVPLIDVPKIEVPEIDTSNLDKFDAQLAAFVASWEEEQARVAELNGMLSDSIVQATTAGMEAFTDMMFGIEGADASAILGALMQPFADTATQLGGMLLAQGIAVDAFKTSLASLQGAPAIAAGLSLLAIGAAMKSGIKALAKGGGGSGSSASYGGSSYGSSSAQNYESTLTVNVVGTISGSDIALSLDRTRKNQKR